MTKPLATPMMWPLPSTDSSSGCFETMRIYEGKIFRLDAHLDRLSASAQYLGVRLASVPRLRQRLLRAVEDSGLREAIIRVALIPVQTQAPREGGWRIMSPGIVVQPVQLPAPILYRRGIRVAVVPTRKFPVSQIDPQAKFSARLGSVMAVADAQLRGVDEALFLDATGSVTESTASNVGMIKDGVFIAPQRWLGLLAGITWQTVIEVAQALEIPVRGMPVTRHELYNADEAFLLSTIKELLPVTVIDGRTIGTGKPGPYTKRLHRAFQQLVKRELKLVRLPHAGGK